MNRKIHRMMLSDMAVIPGLHENLLSVMRALQKSFQVTSEGEALILKKNLPKISFDKKMENNGGK